MSHVLSSATGMILHLLMHFIDTYKGLMVRLRSCELPEGEETFGPLENYD